MAEPVGRHDECEAITTFLDALSEGHGGVLLLEGEGGTGKTTLAEWAAARAGEQEFVVLSGRSWEMSQSVPYEPIVAALGRFVRSRPEAEIRAMTAGLSSLATLIDGLDFDSPAGGIGDIVRARLHDAVATFLSRIASKQPVVFLLDDLHWSDVSSLELLQFICRDFPFVALGLIATVRPRDADERVEVRSFLAPLRRAAFCTSVNVRNLDRSETEVIVTERLGGSPPDRLVELVWSRSIGTPLLVHEMVEDLLGRNLLIETTNGWVLTDDDPPLPRAAGDLLQGRVARAEPTERGLLEILAVDDEPTTTHVLATVAGLDDDETADRLRRLRDKRLVAQIVDHRGEVRWHTDHPIIAHVVAGELDQIIRQRLHRQLLAANPSAPIARQARHVLGGGPPLDPAAAISILIEAGEVAFRQGANTQALTNFDAAETLLDTSDSQVGDGAAGGDESENDEQRFRIHLGRGQVLMRIRRSDEAVAALEQAWTLAVALDDPASQLAALDPLDQALFLADVGIDRVLARLDRLEEHFSAHENWDGLTEVLLRRYLAWGRNAQASASLDLVDSLDRIGTRRLGARATEIRNLLELTDSMFSGSAHDFVGLTEQLLDRAAGDADWDLRRRAALTALEAATHLGTTELLDRAVSGLRSVEAEIGERANWRLPIRRALLAAQEGQDLGDLDALLGVGQRARARRLVAFVRALDERFRNGPEAALALYDSNRPTEHIEDTAANLYDVLGRMVIAEGTAGEAEAAAAVMANSLVWARGSLFTLAYFDYGALLSLTIAGSEAELDDALERLHRPTGNPDLPTAWRTALQARQCEDDAERAALLLAAADNLEGCGYRLEAASRVIEAAEADVGSVDPERVIAAGSFARSCGAQWIAGRAAAVTPSLASIQAAAVDDGLTRREWEVACQVARGLTNREVGQELFISIRTVTSHLDHIYTKLGFSSREELTDYVAERADVNT